MSINKKRFSSAIVICAAVSLWAIVCPAQDVRAKIKISADATASVEGEIAAENSRPANLNWSFINSIAGAENLGARISDFTLTGNQNRAVAFKKLIDGEYLADERADAFQYRINLKPSNSTAASHVSWLDGEQGILMLDDLLPHFSANENSLSWRIEFDLPGDWKIISSEKKSAASVFEVRSVGKAIFAVGKNWRVTEQANLNLAVSGEWRFADREAAAMASEIYAGYAKLFGDAVNDKPQIFLVRLPAETKFGRWQAETRGSTTTVASADMPFKTTSLQLLHEQLRHEIFHLWIPNRLALTGNYDWFYEGFTVYQSLRTGVATNQIRFDDYLDTLAQAYDLDNLQTQKTSLIESSKNRWSGANSQVYARGMLAAFLCDAAILKQSKGARSIENLFQEIYRKHRVPNESADGNTAITNVLKNYVELKPIIENYVEGTERINWKTYLDALGIEAAEENSFVKLHVKAKPDGRQKDLLNKLGYNNWRKTSEKLK